MAGDSDIVTNIGYDGEAWRPYDFDQAGGPVEKAIENLEEQTKNRVIDVDVDDIAVLIQRRLSEADVDRFMQDFEDVMDEFFPERLGFNGLDSSTYRHNLKILKNGRIPLKGEMPKQI